MSRRPRPLSDREREVMHACGEILSASLRAVVASLTSGVTATEELDRIAEREIRSRGGVPAFKGYRGYPASLCVSLNDEVVHGIPGPNKMLKNGDVVGLDLGVQYRGLFTDMATTVILGGQSSESRRLIDVTRKALRNAVGVVRNGCRTGDIGAVVQSTVEAAGFNVIRDLVGHGVGRTIHDEPSVPNFGERGSGDRLQSGTAIAIEPMVVAGDYRVTTDPDGWTVRTADGGIAAHEEWTVLVTDEGSEIITPSIWEES